MVDAGESLARTLARFSVATEIDAIPADVVARAKLFLLDAIGIALASTTHDFARVAGASAAELGEGRGSSTVIGGEESLPLRDAVLLNGVLVHGLDYDDTHPEGVVHASASAVPTVLGVGEALGVSGRDLLTAYIVGLEATARLGIAAQGGFHAVGFHPTGLLGAFGSALIAAKLRRDDVDVTTAAQGVVGSFASGSLEFLDSGAWTKRVHPGWAGVAGITAESLARHGLVAPELVYEGRFGLYASHLGDRPVDLAATTRELGRTWETLSVAVKPFPACHFTHAFADAALALRADGLRAEDVESITCLIGEGQIETVCEPRAHKLAPRSSYDAQFSLPYVVAASLVHGEFGLSQLEDDALTDAATLALAARVTHEADPDSAFPRAFSGEIIVRRTDGSTVRHRESINRGAGDRPLPAADIEEKFRSNAAMAVRQEQAEAILTAVHALESFDDVGEFTALLSLT
ncbi:MmgE/PrpD family protein [Microbacterium sp. SLBN-146]|uniref:MmgE/PrpD family protein n=1 Tax=Microbacterium sp. SLBN-146 TaxID=2768457 RepID=UPI0011532725|nr:MmgE/PrpD family protein [Microbacterium sp. SLBN-146]TQJ29912.1 2-methylcitrate dehydratase PrpD [Microbacterium sp. SLBN-146]